jgi:hypothetical protein
LEECKPSDCCYAHADTGCDTPICTDCVCDLDPTCCDEAWDETCELAAESDCLGDCTCQADNDCCYAHPGTGCQDATCTACVCAANPFCCSTAWDNNCRLTAGSSFCKASCGCTNAPGQDCCFDRSLDKGCSDPVCEACVCSLDPFCCTSSWDGFCGGMAEGPCQAACPVCPK